MRPLYHLLDPLWARAPLPVRPHIEVEAWGPVTAVRMARPVFGRTLMAVYAYVVDDALVDTGLASSGRELGALVRERGVRRAIVTHHHEDHAGNAAGLAAAGVEVLARPDTAALVGAGLPIPFYEHLAWGKPPPARGLATLGDEVALGARRGVVVAAPGHCVDQVVLHVPEEGWLFSGDVFLHERVRLFRRDEDFAATVATLRRLVALDFDTLYCAHRPRLDGGKAALAAKLDHLVAIEEEVRALHARGLPPRRIARSLGLPRPGLFEWLTAGDASTENLVRSILQGPTPRPEVTRALAG